MRTVFQGEHFTDEARSAQRKPHPLLTILGFIGVMAVSESVSMLIIRVIGLAVFFSNPAPESELSINGVLTGISLILTVAGIIAAILYCRLFERRSLASMGIKREKCVRFYALGAVIGAAMFSAVVMICLRANAVRYVGSAMYSVPIFVLICVGWIIQGAQEEILCRGLLMGSLSARIPLWGAVLINSAFFSILHIFNGGFNLIVFVNLTLFGLCMSVMALRFNSIVPCCAAHSLWNLVQGNVFGLPVSGSTAGPSVKRFELPPDMDFMTGGEFGIEGGLGTTVILGVMTACLMFVPEKNDEQ